MTTQKFDIKKLFDGDDNLAAAVPASELFGIWQRAMNVPPGWVALVIRPEGDRQLFTAGAELAEDDVSEVIFVRSGTIRLHFDALRCLSVDDFECIVECSLRLTPVCEPAELHALRRTIIDGSGLATRSSLEAHFEPYVQTAAAQCAEGRGVGVLIDAAESDTFAREAAEALKGPAFSSGLTIEKPVHVRFDSPVYRQVRLARAERSRKQSERDARRRIESAAEDAQRRHGEHLSELLARLRTEADQSPGVDLGTLLKTFSEQERGELYTALLVDQPADHTKWIVVGAGSQLLYFAPDAPEAAVETRSIDDCVGAVRSVQTADDGAAGGCLLVGAAHGVHEVPVESGQPTRIYRSAASDDVRGGVNSVAVVGDHLVASHSELGLLCWKRGSDTPARCLQEKLIGDAKAVRGVLFHDGDVYVGVDNTVLRMHGDRLDEEPRVYRGSRSTITSVCVCREGLFCGNADGEILAWGDDESEEPERIHAGRRRSAESTRVLDAGDVPRLVYTDTSIAVFVRVLGDTFTCRYEAGGQTLRRVEAAPDLIVATNEVRDRLVCWRPGDPSQPYGLISIGQLTGHSIQDVALVPRG